MHETITPGEAGARARRRFETGGLLCAESVAVSVAEALGLDAPLLPRMATGLCAGLCRNRGTCGALLGGMLAMGLAQGRDTPEEKYDDLFALAGGLVAAFRERFGSDNCLELTGCDLGDAEGQRRFAEEKVKQNKCLDFVEFAAAVSVERLAQAGPQKSS